jgi:hypothetical protein
MTDDSPIGTLRLDHISTSMANLSDMGQFVMRYGGAVRRYILAILRDEDATDEVWQDMVARLLLKGEGVTWPGRGRFRDYLRMTARNAALTHLRTKSRRSMADLADDVAVAADRELDSHWQKAILEKVWRELDAAEMRGQGNFVHTALRVYSEHPELDSSAQARRVGEKLGRAISPDAFRQQVRRGKRQMAELILIGVAGTIASADASDVEAELVELGLMKFVEDYLPPDWRSTFFGG